MQFLPTNVNFDESKKHGENEKREKLRFIERQFGRTLEDWHFRLLPEFDEPIKIYTWFKNAIMQENNLYFDGGDDNGIVAFNWVREHYRLNLKNALGEIQVLLAKDGKILKSFCTVEK